MLKIIDVEVMIGGEGFTQRSRAAHVKTRSPYQAVEGFMNSSIEYVERKVLMKVKNKKEDRGGEGTGRKEKRTGGNFSWFACPSAGAYARHYGPRVRLFPTSHRGVLRFLFSQAGTKTKFY